MSVLDRVDQALRRRGVDPVAGERLVADGLVEAALAGMESERVAAVAKLPELDKTRAKLRTQLERHNKKAWEDASQAETELKAAAEALKEAQKKLAAIRGAASGGRYQFERQIAEIDREVERWASPLIDRALAELGVAWEREQGGTIGSRRFPSEKDRMEFVIARRRRWAWFPEARRALISLKLEVLSEKAMAERIAAIWAGMPALPVAPVRED